MATQLEKDFPKVAELKTICTLTHPTQLSKELV